MNSLGKGFAVLIACFVLTGCGEKTKQEKPEAQNSSQETGTIEITLNDNAQEIKVKAKKTDQSKSKSFYYDYDIKSEYDQNAQPANEDAAVRVRPRTTVDANIQVRSPYEKVQISLIVKKLSKNFRIKCSACHDDYANGIIGPSLLNRNADYIYDKIAEFKSGKKSNPLMNDLIHMMSNEEIHTLSDEIYEFNQQIKEMREKK